MARTRIPQETPPPTFTAPGLRIAADMLEEKVLSDGNISIGIGVELRALAAHLRQLAAGAATEPQEGAE